MRRWWIRTLEQLTRPQVLATVAPALVTYVMSAVGLSFTEFTLVELDAGSPGILGAAFGVALFTLSFASLPVAMGYAWSSDRELGFMAWLGLAGMLGIPVLILAAETSWLSLLGFLVHLLMAPRGTRLWLAIRVRLLGVLPVDLPGLLRECCVVSLGAPGPGVPGRGVVADGEVHTRFLGRRSVTVQVPRQTRHPGVRPSTFFALGELGRSSLSASSGGRTFSVTLRSSVR